MQQRLVHEVVVVLLELRDLVGLDVRPRLFEPVSHDDLHQVVDGSLNFQVFTGKHVYFHLDVIMLIMNKIINSKRLVVGQIHQARARDHFQIVLDAMFDHVVDARHELFQSLEAVVHMSFIRVDVHRRPGQRHHARPQLRLHVVKVGSEDHGRDGNHHRHHSIVLVQGPVQVVVVRFQFIFLKQ